MQWNWVKILLSMNRSKLYLCSVKTGARFISMSRSTSQRAIKQMKEASRTNQLYFSPPSYSLTSHLFSSSFVWEAETSIDKEIYPSKTLRVLWWPFGNWPHLDHCNRGKFQPVTIRGSTIPEWHTFIYLLQAQITKGPLRETLGSCRRTLSSCHTSSTDVLFLEMIYPS